MTHAVCVGMTGSGKTGLCIGLLEEAAIDGIPALIIDPKGDLANLLLTFPRLDSQDFAPWINEDDARKKGLSPASMRPNRRRYGKKVWLSGGRMGHAFKSSAMRPSASCIRRGAMRGFPCRSSTHLPRLRRKFWRMRVIA